jgi:shikimate dehydrogenase
MRRFGLIGYPLTHSFSAGYFAKKFAVEHISDAIYENFPLESIGQFDNLLKTHADLAGLNVTIPYKEQIIRFLDDIDPEAQEIGAVNTVKTVRAENGYKLKGYNSDVYGFQNTLQPLLNDYHKKALILGTGGASKAIKFVLKKLGIAYISASIEELKENEIRYADITKEMIGDRLLIINATPLGTFPKVDACPSIPYEYITPRHVLYDLVYNPEETLFLKTGKAQGAKTFNGLGMLHLQAEKAWEIWNQKTV